MFPAGRKDSYAPLLLLLLVTTVIGMSACGKQESAQKYLEDAKAFRQKGDEKAAIIQLKNALQLAPDNGEARYLLGTLYNETGDYQSAENELQRAQELGIAKSRLLVALGEALLNQGKLQKILAEITPEPGFKSDVLAGILTVRGNAYLSLNKPKEAKDAIDAALKQQPDYAEAYLGLARLAILGQDLDGALRQISTALGKSPRSVQAWLLKGDVLRLKNAQQESLAAYLQAEKIDPKNAAAHLALASAYLAENRVVAARKEVDAAQKLAPNNLFVRYLTAQADFREGKFAQAKEQLQQVLRVAPDHMPSVLLSGVVNYSLGNYGQAEADLNKFLNLSPGNLYARKILTASLLKTNQPGRALTALQPVLADKTQDPQLLVLAGEVYKKLKQYDKAIGYLKKAAALDPNNATLRTDLALGIMMDKGNTDLAVTELKSASALDASRYQADTLLILTYLTKKEYNNALQATFVLEKKQPKNPVTFNFRGGAYLGMGDTVNARKSFERALALQPSYVGAAINLAKMDVKDKKPDAARKRLENVLAVDKNNLEAMRALADLALRSGQMDAYAGWLEKAIRANPDALAPRKLLASYYMQKHEPDKALRLAREVLDLGQDNPDALDFLGSIQVAIGEKDKALATYTKLVTIAPDPSAAFYKLALLQVSMKNTNAAKLSLKKVLELSPANTDAQAALISLEVQDGNIDEALLIARQMQKQAPKAAMGFVLEGDIQLAQKHYDQAENVYDKAFAVDNNGLTAIKRYEAKTLAGHVKEADAELLQWLKAKPKDITARSYLAQVYMTRGDNKLAIVQYQELLKNQPDNPSGLNNLAWLYYREKDPRALEVAEQVYKLQPNAAPIADTFGWILLEQGKTARGVGILQKAVSLAPNSPEIGYHYAVALFKSGDKQKARKQLEHALASGQSFPQQDEARALLKQW